MKSTSTIRSAFLLGLSLFLEHSALAGWSGQMNGFGAGRTTVTVNSPGLPLKAATWATPLNWPLGTPTTVSASMPPIGYQTDASLPNPLAATVARSKGEKNYFWQNSLSVGTDGTDNERIQKRVTIVPVSCASLEMTTHVVWDTDDENPTSGYIIVEGTATDGTAALLRLLEKKDSGEPDPDLDYDDPTKGNLLGEFLLVGPFIYAGECFKFHFKFSGDKNKLWLSSDGVALSKEFKISCPQTSQDNPLLVPCNGTMYPVTAEGGCGSLPPTITFDINPDQLIPGAPAVQVTATAEDTAEGVPHNKVQCKFWATRAGLTAILCSDAEFSCFSGPGSYSPTPVGACGAVTYTYTPKLESLPIDIATVVSVIGKDADGNTASCSFTATRHALGFDGFFPPLQAPGGTCGPNGYVETIKRGSLIPVKFTTSCDGQTTFEGATPPYCKFIRCGEENATIEGGFKKVSNSWHFQIDTNLVPPGIYRISVLLQDQITTKEIVVRIK